MAVIVLISFRATVEGLLKDHAVAVFYVLTTRSSTRSPYTTSMDSTPSSKDLIRQQSALTPVSGRQLGGAHAEPPVAS
jgi:hypothetical protein